MKVLVIGSGGREHALVWKISQSPRVKKIYCAPGSAGMEALAEGVIIPSQDLDQLLSFAKKEKIDLTVVGPELPLTLGIVDLFEKEGLKIFGPRKEAALLEGSKAFTKKLLLENGIPTAHFEVFEDYDRAIEFLKTQAYPLVIKADGLAAGKGVLIAQDRAQAVEGLDLIFKKKAFGEAGRKAVIEEFLAGEEASFHALIDGKSILPLDSAQDHKRVGDGDTGLNTGGMGVYSPAPVVTEAIRDEVIERILKPTLRGLLKKGITYRGVLYAGLMITSQGPKLLEYNVRFGDPETQALLMRLDEDLLEVMEATVDGRLQGKTLRWKKDASVCVVMAAHGYPGEVRAGDEIRGLEVAASIPETVVFHAGTKKVNQQWLTAGGRVLGVTALGKDVRQARERAYDVCEKIYWAGVHYRKDIGRRGMNKSYDPGISIKDRNS